MAGRQPDLADGAKKLGRRSKKRPTRPCDLLVIPAEAGHPATLLLQNVRRLKPANAESCSPGACLTPVRRITSSEVPLLDPVGRFRSPVGEVPKSSRLGSRVQSAGFQLVGRNKRSASAPSGRHTVVHCASLIAPYFTGLVRVPSSTGMTSEQSPSGPREGVRFADCT
jgi:hypothetical protein